MSYIEATMLYEDAVNDSGLFEEVGFEKIGDIYPLCYPEDYIRIFGVPTFTSGSEIWWDGYIR